MKRLSKCIVLLICLFLFILPSSIDAASNNGCNISGITKLGTSVTATVSCPNESGTAICAIYDSSGRMINMDSTSVYGTERCSFSFNTSSFTDAKVFLVDAKGHPLCESSNLAGRGNAPRVVLTSEQIYAQCSPAVFTIKYSDFYDDINGYYTGSGSGFFISSNGIAITNYHVIEDAVYADAILYDGRVLEITSVLYYSAADDVAIIKVEGSGYPTIPLGDSSTVKGGQKIYTIGSPQGLSNTISDGMVSNPNRDGFIQISAPISPGSSGGALLNEYGEAIGITQGTFNISGNSLNRAVPINKAVSPDVSATDLDNLYSEQSFIDFAYDNGNIPTNRQLAFNSLAYYIYNNYTYISSADQSRWITQTINIDDGPLDVSILYDIETDSIRLFNYSGSNSPAKSSLMIIEPGTSDVYMSYNIEFDNAPDLSGSGFSLYDSSYFTPNFTISFDSYTGLDVFRQDDENDASLYFEISLLYLDIIMNETNSGYTLSDLGFTNF